MQSSFTVTNHSFTAANVIRSARVIALGIVFVLLAFGSAAAQPLTDTHRGRDLPAGNVSYSSWELVKQGHRYHLMRADGVIAAAPEPAERRHRAFA